MRYRPQNKFEEIIAGIFAVLFYGALFGGGLFVVGITIYKLIVRDWGFFKEEGLAIPFSIIFIGIIIVIIRANRRQK